MGDTGRVYRGLSEPERRAERRARLLTAGLTLFGTVGWDETTIERICADAQVSTRYFYIEFADREALMAAVYERAAFEGQSVGFAHLQRTELTMAERTAAGIAAYVRHVTDDPRRARVVHAESRRVASLGPVRARVLTRFLVEMSKGGLVERLVGDPAALRVLGQAVQGAVSEVLIHWVTSPEPRPPVEPMARELGRMVASALPFADAATPAAHP